MNLLASRMVQRRRRELSEGLKNHNLDFDVILDLWKQYAKLYINEIQLQNFEHTFYLTFESWLHGDKNSLFTHFKIPNIHHADFNTPLFGGGSSFGNKAPCVEELNKRWYQFIFSKDPHYEDLIDEYKSLLTTDKEVPELMTAIYGEASKRRLESL